MEEIITTDDNPIEYGYNCYFRHKGKIRHYKLEPCLSHKEALQLTYDYHKQIDLKPESAIMAVQYDIKKEIA